jgi:hypothetical protein
MANISDEKEATVAVNSLADSEIQSPAAVSNSKRYLYHLPRSSTVELFTVI